MMANSPLINSILVLMLLLFLNSKCELFCDVYYKQAFMMYLHKMVIIQPVGQQQREGRGK